MTTHASAMLSLSRALFIAIINLGTATSLLPAATTSEIPQTGVRRAGWAFREDVLLSGSRSACTIGHLQYRGRELPGDWAPAITPVGEFDFAAPTVEDDWRPAGVPGWTQAVGVDGALSARTTETAKPGSDPFSTGDHQRGWYLGAFDARKSHTPDSWFFSRAVGAWVDPVRIRAQGAELLTAHGQLKSLLAAIDAYHAKIGRFPSELVELKSGPEGTAAGDWQPLAGDADLTDPWGTAWTIEVLPEIHATEQGRDFVLRSPGPDKALGTDDDFVGPASAPPPAAPESAANE